MSHRDAIDDERARQLIMAAVDGELSQDDRQELERLMAGDPRIRQEWERMSRLKEVTNTMRFQKPPEEVWGSYWTSVYNRTERGIGWILVSLGSIVLLGYGAYKWIETIVGADDLPVFLKLAILAVAFGLIILVVSVIREKLFTRRHDPYKEVER